MMFRRLLLTSSLIVLDSFPLNYSRQSVVLRTSRHRLNAPVSCPASRLPHSNSWLAAATPPGRRIVTMPSSTTRTRFSSRVSASKQTAEDSENKESLNVAKGDGVPADSSSEQGVVPSKPAATKKRASPKKKTASKKSDPTENKATEKTDTPDKKKRGRSPKGSTVAAIAKISDDKEPQDDNAEASDAETQSKASKKTKGTTTTKKAKGSAADHQRVTERSELPKLWDAKEARDTKGSYTFRIASWNVAGLRAVLRKDPDALATLCQSHDLDMLCLQETKLQESHLIDPKLKLPNGQMLQDVLKDAGYDAHWSCSTSKKGYSGTAVFVKQYSSKKGAKQKSINSFFQTKGSSKSSKAESTKEVDESSSSSSNLPINPNVLKSGQAVFQMGQEIDSEGRMVLLDFPFASIANVYVPNSGQVLERLSYRTEEWDKQFLAFMQQRQTDRNKPVIWLGDLNIAHTARDVWNDGAKHLDTQAGVTPQERASFQEQLDAGFVDAFRELHPTAQGHYSYWSQRAGNREPNKGLRLDYFVCSPDLFLEDKDVVVRDSYMISDQLGSDHCPVVLELELKKTIGE